MRKAATKTEDKPTAPAAGKPSTFNLQPSTLPPLVPPWALVLVLFVATALAYLPVWHAGFIWDDDAYVTNNPTLRSLGGLREIWFSFTGTPQYYPLVFTSFWLECHLWGLDPLGYHVVNVFLHALAAVFLWRVLMRLQLPGAWLAAAIFALHPLGVESVAWVTERKNVLAAVFYFAAALAALRWMGVEAEDRPQIRGSSRWHVAAFALFVAALLSKTVACSLPAALLVVVWWKRGRIAGRDVWPLLPFFVAGAGMSLVTSWLERTHVGAQGPEWDFTFAERFLIAGRAIWFYAGKLFWPANLTFIYPRWHPDAGAWWQWIYPVAALGVVAALWVLRRRVGRGPLAAALFFGGTLFPGLGFANVYPMRFSFVADHFQYLAGTGLIVLAACGITRAWERFGNGSPWLKPAFCAVLLVTLGTLTERQCRTYANLETLWRTTVNRNPACWLARNGLGAVDVEHGRYDEAISQFQEAIRLKPDYFPARNNLGFALLIRGRTDEAISEFREALRLAPDDPGARLNLGNALLKKGRPDEAMAQYQEAIRLKPDFPLARLHLGNIFFDRGQTTKAADQYQAALRIEPDSGGANAGFTNVIAMNNQAWVLATSPDAGVRDGARAVQLAERACQLTHYQTTIMVGTLAAAYAETGRFDDAVATGQKACALASELGETNLMARNQELVTLYQSHQPYHEPVKAGSQ